MKHLISTLLAVFAFVQLQAQTGYDHKADIDSIYNEIDKHNLVSAYTNLYPQAAFMSLWNAYYDEGSSKQHVGIMEQSVDPEHVVLTANSQTLYAVHPVDLDKEHNGAVVLEVPAMTLGMINTPGWHCIADLGPFGADRGKGGKYLITSPNYSGEIPEGYFHVKSNATTIVWLIRGFVKDGDWVGAANYLKDNIKTYSLSEATNPPATSFYNTSKSRTVDNKPMDMLWEDGDVFDLIKQYFELNGVTARHENDYSNLFDMGFFEGEVSEEMKNEVVDIAMPRIRAISFSNRYEKSEVAPGLNWKFIFNVKDEHWTSKEYDGYTLSQNIAYINQATFSAGAMVRAPKGVGSVYMGAFKDSEGVFLSGENTYKLHIEGGVPAQKFWSVIAYNATNRSMIINDDLKNGVSSYDEGMEENKDGSLDIYFSPKKPRGVKKANWVQTNKGDGFFLYFRLYSPGDAWFDGSWKLHDLERVN